MDRRKRIVVAPGEISSGLTSPGTDMMATMQCHRLLGAEVFTGHRTGLEGSADLRLSGCLTSLARRSKP